MSAAILLVSLAALEAEPSIVITGAREPVEAGEAPVAATVIEEEVLDALSLPLAADVLRLSPGVSVAVGGPRGTQTQLRIRGAEANHTLLFVDGIRFNDPAAGNEARFELLGTDLLSRLEVVRGPQSALWGSEALGGVVAVSSADPLDTSGFAALGESGSLESKRLFGRYAFEDGGFGLSAGAGWQTSDGIDSFGSGGERDGFETAAFNLKSVYRSGPIEVGAVGHWIEGVSAFDGFDQVTFRRADTLDETENRIGAARGWFSASLNGWRARAALSYLDSANRNRRDGEPLNNTFGDRFTLEGQVARDTGSHQFIAAVEHQGENFRARDSAFFGGTDQERSRNLTAFVGTWRADWTGWLTTDLAVRQDEFSAFDDATTLRASVLVRPARGWVVHSAYGEGIAQPTFYDLYGFFPGSFAGNPKLRPERSRGWELGLRWQNARFDFAVVGFLQRLRDEILDVFDPDTFLSSTENADGRSRRDGIEVAASYTAGAWLNLAANYTFLDSGEQRVAGTALVREIRRPRHSANLIAYGRADRFSWGASMAYVGARRDTDFDLFPAATVRLDDYVLAALRLGWRVLPGLELFGRLENALDADYQDVVGYNVPGRTVYAGLRVVLGD